MGFEECKRTIEEQQKEIVRLKEVEKLYYERHSTQEKRITEIRMIAELENGNLWKDIQKAIKGGITGKSMEGLSKLSMSKWLGEQNPVLVACIEGFTHNTTEY